MQLASHMVRESLRILVIDGCQLNAWLVGRLVPPGVSIEQAQSFDRARAVLTADPPDAAILNVTPCDLPWGELADLCREHDPPIPFLLCSTVFDEPELAKAHPGPNESFCYKPVSVAKMRQQIEALVRRARRGDSFDLDETGDTEETSQTPVV